MYQYPNMLMLGSAGRNTGKTELACQLIRRYRNRERVIGLKITTVDSSGRPCPRGKGGCGVCTSFSGKYELIEETCGPAEKDTVRMLEAGAHRVFWLKVREADLVEGVSALRSVLDDDACIICESNSCRRALEPGLFLVLKKQGSTHIKKTCRAVMGMADKTLEFHGRGWNPGANRIRFSKGRWGLSGPATAVVLAGGKSRRMGRDKSMLPLGGKPMIERIVEQLRVDFADILISSNTPQKHGFLGLPLVSDRQSGMGPLMGILSALELSATELNFVTSCDAPNINLNVVRKMLQAAENHDLVIPMSEEGRFEPLYAVYRKSVTDHIHDLLSTGHRKISDLFERVDVHFLPFDGSGWYENLNTMADLERYRHRFLRDQITTYTKLPAALAG